jgi:hypothetical protein
LDQSFDKGVPEVVGTADIDDFVQVGVLAYEHSVLFTHEIAVVDKLLVQVVDLVVGRDNPDTRF